MRVKEIASYRVSAFGLRRRRTGSSARAGIWPRSMCSSSGHRPVPRWREHRARHRRGGHGEVIAWPAGGNN